MIPYPPLTTAATEVQTPLIERAKRPLATSAFTADLTRLRKMFELAQEKGLAHPKIKIEIDGVSLRFAPAPLSGRNPGYIYVHRRRADGAFVYTGKVAENGTYFGHSGDGALAAIRAFAADPASRAAAHGHKTGMCCFCSRELTDPASVAVGYGPICADRYGLPYGELRAAEQVLDVTWAAA